MSDAFRGERKWYVVRKVMLMRLLSCVSSVLKLGSFLSLRDRYQFRVFCRFRWKQY